MKRDQLQVEMVTCWCLQHATRSTPHDIHLNAKTCRHPFPSSHSVTNHHRIHKHSLQLYFPFDESPTDNYLSQNVDPRRLNKKELGFFKFPTQFQYLLVNLFSPLSNFLSLRCNQFSLHCSLFSVSDKRLFDFFKILCQCWQTKPSFIVLQCSVSETVVEKFQLHQDT